MKVKRLIFTAWDSSARKHWMMYLFPSMPAYTCITRCRFVDKKVKAKFTEKVKDSFVEDNPYVKYCPSTPFCGNTVLLKGTPNIPYEIFCGCGCNFWYVIFIQFLHVGIVSSAHKNHIYQQLAKCSRHGFKSAKMIRKLQIGFLVTPKVRCEQFVTSNRLSQMWQSH